MLGQRRNSGAWWAFVEAHAPKISTCVILVFALATILPWFGYAWITEMDRVEQFANAEERLELLAAVYAQRTVEAIHVQADGPSARHFDAGI